MTAANNDTVGAHLAADTPCSSSDATVHEQQHKQLCAVHCVNNLLQLTASSASADDDTWVCGTHVLTRTASQVKPATEQELNDIADNLTVVENQLLSGNSVEKNKKPSWLEKARSNHRTPLLGNYSIEVLETALNNRGVELTRYRPNETASASSYEKHNNVVIGFIINEETCYSGSRRNRIQQKMMKWLGMGGRHWYAITRISRVSGEEAQQQKQEVSWRVLNSESDRVVDHSDEFELMECLRSVSQYGGTIFRATLNATAGDGISMTPND